MCECVCACACACVWVSVCSCACVIGVPDGLQTRRRSFVLSSFFLFFLDCLQQHLKPQSPHLVGVIGKLFQRFILRHCFSITRKRKTFFVREAQLHVFKPLVRGPIPKSRLEKAVWSHEGEQRFLYINVKIRPSLVRLGRLY